MKCDQCVAFEKSYRMAIDHYASVLTSLKNTSGIKIEEYRKLKIKAEVARGVQLMTKEALRVHKEGHKKT